MSSTVYYNIFFLLGGIAVLMFGMKYMGANLELVAGGNMRKMLGKMTSNRFAGVGIGALVTAIINSSTATTVMLVGFVNVGLLTLSQATSVIMGANIGTTITAQILSLSGGEGLDINAIAALIAALGIICTMFTKKDKVHKLGNILIGIGLIFIGLKIMSLAVDYIVWADKANQVFRFEWMRTFLQGNVFPLILILVGIVLTAIVHSSAAVTGILIALGAAINFQTAVFVILGSNVGTCITSLVSSIGTSVNAKRTAIIHLLFNLFGCVIFIVPCWIWGEYLDKVITAISGSLMERKIANFHTVFNLLTTILLLPFTNLLVKLVTKIVPDKADDTAKKHSLTFIDSRLLETPPVAVEYTKKEIVKMSGIAKENLILATDMLLGNGENAETLKDNEKALNYLNHSITAFLTQLMSKGLTEKDEKKIGSYYHVVSDVERIGDYAENIMEYYFKLKEEGQNFSDGAIEELKAMTGTVLELFDVSVRAFENRDLSLLTEVDRLEKITDQYSIDLEDKHIERVKKGGCSAQVGSVYLQTVSNLERVGDHITNIGFSIKNYVKA